MRRVRGGLAGHGQRPPPQPLDAVDGELGAIGAHLAPFDTAVVREDSEDGIAARQIRVHGIGAPDPQRTRGLAQHEKTDGVIELSVDENDPGDGRVARSARGLQHGIRLELREDVG